MDGRRSITSIATLTFVLAACSTPPGDDADGAAAAAVAAKPDLPLEPNHQLLIEPGDADQLTLTNLDGSRAVVLTFDVPLAENDPGDPNQVAELAPNGNTASLRATVEISTLGKVINQEGGGRVWLYAPHGPLTVKVTNTAKSQALDVRASGARLTSEEHADDDENTACRVGTTCNVICDNGRFSAKCQARKGDSTVGGIAPLGQCTVKVEATTESHHTTTQCSL